MIKANARLSIAVLPLDKIQIREFQRRFPEKLNLYVQLLSDNPEDYAGLLSVTPSDTHEGMFALLDGHHRMAACIMTGRKEHLCLIIEEPGQESEEQDATAVTTSTEAQETTRPGLSMVE
jgi:hypothetical protein